MQKPSGFGPFEVGDATISVPEAVLSLRQALPTADEKQHAQISAALASIDQLNYTEKDHIQQCLVDIQGPISDVDSIVPQTDDPALPVNTFRAWSLGLLYALIGAGVNTFFAERLPGIALSGFVAQLVAFPSGKLLERILPNRQYTFRGKAWSLNPGPFNAKEHMLITIIANVSFSSSYASSIIIAQRLPQFYNMQWASSLFYQLLLCLSSQIIGYGFAGLARPFLVYAPAAVWPGNLAVLALNRSFHDNHSEPVHGWRISRLALFARVFLISSLYFFIPNYLFTSISQLNWLTWIKEDNAVLAAMTGSYTGLGMNPFPTLDYNIVSGIVDPLITPFFATVNVVVGMLLSAAILAILWFKNAWYASYLPIVSNRSFDRFGHSYNVTRILKDARLDVAAYEAYSPVYISAANAFIFGGYFALYPATLVYAYLYHGTEIADAIRNLFGKGRAVRKDIHVRLMEAYREVPGWWYLGVMLLGTALALLMIGLYPTGMPVWGLAVSIALGALFILPVGLIAAVSNVEIGLNVLSEMIAGLAMPGNPSGMMIFKAYGTLSLAQGLSFAADLKLGHYSKIPPRTLFAAQVIGTFLSVFMTVFVTNWQINHLEDFCMPDQKQKFTCPGSNTFFTSSIIWGVLGPKQSYGSQGLYRHLLWGALIGLVLPIPFYCAAKRYPSSLISKVHPPILLAGMISWAPVNLSYITAAVPIAYLFHVQIKQRFYAWWAKYTYVIATGLSTGIAITGIVAFVALQNPGIELSWIGNSIGQLGCDKKGCPLIPLAPGQYFGPGAGDFRYV